MTEQNNTNDDEAVEWTSCGCSCSSCALGLHKQCYWGTPGRGSYCSESGK